MGITKYRKGQQRSIKDRKGPQRTHKEPQRSITQDHRRSAIMRKLPDLQQFCLIFKNYFVYFFVNFGVLMNYGGLQNDHFETPAQINQSFCFLFCVVGTWSTKTSQFLPSIWILGRCRTVRLPSVYVDCCVPCSNAFTCQREHSVPDALPLRL